MVKRAVIVFFLLVLLAVAACSSDNATTSTTPAPTKAANISQIRQAEIAKAWTVEQMEINLESATSILLKLPTGGEVSGYFYLEKGSDIDFQISGQSLIYESTPPGAGIVEINSDRFAFTASVSQGVAYTLKFTPVIKQDVKKVTPVVFLELVYPAAGEIFTPIDTK